MENTIDVLSQLGQNRLEQVYVNMPEVRFYFSGDREQTEGNLIAYIDKEELELQSLHRFEKSGNGINYYLLLDISASITKEEFTGITDALAKFCATVREQDQVTFLTFGEEVKTLFEMGGTELAAGHAEELILQLKNEDQRTLLFEAVNQMAELCEKVTADESTRRVGLVITDGEDIATGKATSEEALATLQKQGIPVYGFAAASAARQSKNALGEFSRSSGGYLTILEKGSEQDGFEGVREEILHSYEALFLADSNLVSHGLVSATLQFQDEAEKQQVQVLQERWIKDTEAPEIAEIAVESSKQLRVIFTEPVSGADAAENFHIKQDTESLMPSLASSGSERTSTVLTFSDDIPGGTYTLECSNLKDCSMEQNLLTETESVVIEGGQKEDTAGQSSPLAMYGWITVLVILAGLAVAAALFWKKLKQRKAVVTVEDKVVLKDNVSVSHHVSIEKKVLEKRQVYFHVRGQKEEIPITIQKSMIVGRSSMCELVFDDPALSRQHFVLELKDGNIMIQNLSQSGFTEVNGIRLGAQSRLLHSGDEIHAGQLRLTIRW